MYLANRMSCEVPAGSPPPDKAFAARVRTDFHTYATATAIRGRADVMQPNVAPSALVREAVFLRRARKLKGRAHRSSGWVHDEPTLLNNSFRTSSSRSSARASRISRSLRLRFLGTTSRTRTMRSPRSPSRALAFGAPAPRTLNCLPSCVPAGSLSLTVPPPGLGTCISPQRRLDEADRHLNHEVVPTPLEDRMLPNPCHNVQVPSRTTPRSSTAPAGNPDLHAVLRPRRYPHRDLAGLA